ncbi:MAG: hybrid sensor histidine kinase/response regulator [Rhodobiaceae bacterium]|nr:hybrid sensor histidine kinase/response regulator [Rhodobiaceae bacterium]
MPKIVPPDAHSDSSLDRHALRMLLGRNLVASLMHIFVAVLVAFVMAGSIPIWRGVAFVTLISAAIIFQIILATRHSTAEWTEEEFLSIRRQFDVSAIWVGCMWGFAGFFLFPVGDPVKQLFLTFVMGGMSLSAVGTQGMRLQTCYSSIIPGMLPLAVRYLFEPGSESLISGGLIFAYIVVLVSLARKINDFMLRAFKLQIEKDDLLESVRTQSEELALAKADAEEANLAKSRFLAQASHDLRQPLHAINLFIESLPEAKTKAEEERILSRVRQSLDVLTKLFDSLLDVTLLDTGGINVRPQVFQPTEVINEVVRDFALVAEACNVELRVAACTQSVVADAVLTRRMLQNLVSNAIRHSEGGVVLIGCRRRGGYLSIDIVDNGAGIPESDQTRIFAEFTRLNSVRMGAEAAPGLGLGLSIVKRVADKLKLSVHLSSLPGKGSVFSIRGFEMTNVASVAIPILPTISNSGVVDGASVFVLDDDENTLEATRLLLERWGCIVQTSQDWNRAADACFDVLICDYELSVNMSGIDVIKALQEAREDIGVIMISGNTSKELRSAADALAVTLLHKPLRPAQLRSALLNTLTRSDESARGRK